MGSFKILEKSAGCPDSLGFKVAGVHCDVRGKEDGRLDLALVISEKPCTVAGVFTQNRMAAAPVRLGRDMLASGISARGFVANSGNANACTGQDGLKDAVTMQEAVAAQIGCGPNEIYVCSTGRIGKRLPLERLKSGIGAAAGKLDTSGEAGLHAADAILTSDTRRKVCTAEVYTEAGTIRISGMAKGAGMIEPNMATMLGFICTDAMVESADLQTALAESVETSFNAITVDGDESTNDTVLLFANGESGIALSEESSDWAAFKAALHGVCEDLARKIVGDGEKITKVVEVCIEGAATSGEARNAARAVANSLLVKSSWYGNDPNWGRVVDALGYSGAALCEESLQLYYADDDGGDLVSVFLKGHTHNENLENWREIVAKPRFRIVADLGQGSSTSRVWSTDLTEGYVNFNKSE